MPKRTLRKTYTETCKAKGQNRPLRTKVKYVPRGLNTPLSPLSFYLIRRSHFCPDCRNPGGKGGWGGRHVTQAGATCFCNGILSGKKTTDVVLRERKQLCAFMLHQSSFFADTACRPSVQSQCCKTDDLLANPPSSKRKGSCITHNETLSLQEGKGTK